MDMSTRRAPVLTLVACLALAFGLSGCGVSPPDSPAPSTEPPTFTGISIDAANHTVAVRDVYVPDPGAAGYPAGGEAPLTMQLWNNTTAPISLIGATLDKSSLELIGGEAPSTAFEVSIPGGGNLPLSQAAGRYLQVACLPAAVPTGATLPIVFTFSNKTAITVNVPVGRFAPAGQPVATGAATATC